MLPSNLPSMLTCILPTMLQLDTKHDSKHIVSVTLGLSCNWISASSLSNLNSVCESQHGLLNMNLPCWPPPQLPRYAGLVLWKGSDGFTGRFQPRREEVLLVYSDKLKLFTPGPSLFIVIWTQIFYDCNALISIHSDLINFKVLCYLSQLSYQGKVYQSKKFSCVCCKVIQPAILDY